MPVLLLAAALPGCANRLRNVAQDRFVEIGDGTWSVIDEHSGETSAPHESVIREPASRPGYEANLNPREGQDV